MVDPGSRYSWLDRLTHRAAFLSGSVQKTASEIEDLLFKRELAEISVERPIFIASVPRAGTTLVLEALSGSSQAGTHRYRDMPFVLAPALWGALSRPFRLPSRLEERAHGDGMQIGYDSPEALEEILWKAFWPKWFKGDTLPLWPADLEAEGFRGAFRSHMRKVLRARAPSGGAPGRYLSKNNANLARLGFLRGLFPDCTLVVPFRAPLDQAESLRRQHQRFLDIHRRDRFTRTYMEDLGHFEFGEIHKPFRFPGMSEIRDRYAPDRLEYWMGYWGAAFREVLQRANDLVLVSYEGLCRAGADGVDTVVQRCGLDGSSFPETPGLELRGPKQYQIDAEALDQGVLKEVQDLHARLLDISVV